MTRPSSKTAAFVESLIFQVGLVSLTFVIVVCLIVVTEVALRRLDLPRKQMLESDWGWGDIALSEKETAQLYKAYGYDWYDEFSKSKKEGLGTQEFKYSPFNLWEAATFHSKYVNFENGFRVTPTLTSQTCSARVSITFHGNSTLAGDGVLRDVDTIPYLVTQDLAEHYAICSVAQNRGTSGYNQMNEFVTFTKELAQQRTSDVYVFYDGATDLIQGVYAGEAQMNESFYRKQIDTTPTNNRFAFLIDPAINAWRSSRLAAMLRFATPERSIATADIFAERSSRALSLAKSMASIGRIIVDSVPQSKVLFYRQTLIFTKPHKTLLEKNIESKSLAELHGLNQLSALFDSELMKTFSAKSLDLRDMSDIFASTQSSIFVDFAHVIPAGNQIIAARMAQDIAKLVSGKTPKPAE